ncbi:MAG: formate dehydrogenase accessory protein FdhE [Nitrospirae bacterium]|nr:formate dehydrogenase accessory protein FdhE [Nitrospirota bacterium]
MCLKWALKPSLVNLRKEMTDQIPIPMRPEPFCPLCGGSPLMAEILSEDRRFLCCGFCGVRWTFPAEGCLSCGNQDREKMGFFLSDDRRYRGYRAETCEICKTYLKTAYRVFQMDYPDDADIEDVVTLPLDVLAYHRGYRKS